MNLLLTGEIQDYDGVDLHIKARLDDPKLMKNKDMKYCEIIVSDRRQITTLQRNKIFALIKDITHYTSGLENKQEAFYETLTAMQLNYIIDLTDSEEIRSKLTYNYCQLCGIDMFSLSKRTENTIDRTTASGFIDWLVELCVKNRIPCNDTLLNCCENQQKYLYICVRNKTCCICGKSAKVYSYGKKGEKGGQIVQALCEHHYNELTKTGYEVFNKKYCISWVKINKNSIKREKEVMEWQHQVRQD